MSGSHWQTIKRTGVRFSPPAELRVSVGGPR
jgi:hypothetical protein